MVNYTLQISEPQKQPEPEKKKLNVVAIALAVIFSSIGVFAGVVILYFIFRR